MSAEWKTIRLHEVASIRNGAGIKQENFRDVGIPLVRVTNFTDTSVELKDCVKVSVEHAPKWKGHQLKCGDILVATVGSWPPNWSSVVGKSVSVPATAVGSIQNQNTCCIQAKPNLADQRFLYYLTRSAHFGMYAANSASGSANQARLPVAKLEAYEFALPPLLEQISIGQTLGAFDDRIALLRETNATLEAMAQALFKSWFVDFDPVHANAGTRSATLPAELQAMFPSTFTDTPQGPVPEGWKLVPFGELLSHTIGGDWGDEQPTEKNDVRVAIIRGTDLPDLANGHSGRVPIRFTSQKKLATRKLQDGDLVLEVSGGSKDQPTGRSLYLTNGILSQFNCPMEPASFCRLLRPATKEIGVLLAQHMTYIYGLGKTWEYQNQSTGISNFQTTHFLENELVTVPDGDVLRAFSETIRPMVDRAHLTQIAQLATLRDTLLPRLISGQLRLPDSAATLAEMGV